MTAREMAFLLAARQEAERLAAIPDPPPALNIRVDTLVIQAQHVVLSSASDYSPNVVINVAAPNVVNEIAVSPGEVRAIVQLPERKARTVTIDGPDGEWKGQIG